MSGRASRSATRAVFLSAIFRRWKQRDNVEPPKAY
jgi:hypothetical protein